jgi:hypothetical protein
VDEAVAKLEADYCPPLDPALVSAIVWDHDLTTEEGLGTARLTLYQLKESALIEEVGGFDVSGTGGHDFESQTEESRSSPSSTISRSEESSATSLSNRLFALGLEKQMKDVGKTGDSEILDEDTKIMLLQKVFGDRVGPYSMKHTLRKCNDN